jgi:hypothetical protein
MGNSLTLLAAAMRVTHVATDRPNDHGRGLRHLAGWSRGSIALTREDCTPKVLPGNSGRTSAAAVRRPSPN